MASPSKLSFNLGIGSTPDTANNEDFIQYQQIYNALNANARALDIYTGSIQPDKDTWNIIGTNAIRSQNINRFYAIFDQVAGPGNIINLYDPGDGTVHARLAIATGVATAARGYSTGTVAIGEIGEIILQGLHPLFSGLLPSRLYYTSTTPGIVQLAAPTAPGSIVQPVGYALSTSALWFAPSLI